MYKIEDKIIKFLNEETDIELKEIINDLDKIKKYTDEDFENLSYNGWNLWDACQYAIRYMEEKFKIKAEMTDIDHEKAKWIGEESYVGYIKNKDIFITAFRIWDKKEKDSEEKAFIAEFSINGKNRKTKIIKNEILDEKFWNKTYKNLKNKNGKNLIDLWKL